MKTSASTAIAEAAAAQVAVPPLTIDRFTVSGEIGRGSNGVVYAATDPVLGRELAIKAIPLSTDSDFRQMMEEKFLQEAQAAAKLNHPNIVTVFDAGKTGSLAYIAMERLHGRDLHDRLTRGPRLTDRQSIELMARVADALSFAHQHGLVHRDVKPGNIFLTTEMKPKVLDFGVALAQRNEQDSSKFAPLVGTPNYMSPEQAQGKAIDARTDIFAVGAILYEMVTGRRAFDGRTMDETIAAVVKCEPAPAESLRADLAPGLVKVIHKAMAKAPGSRHQNATALRDDLLALIGQSIAQDEDKARRQRARSLEEAAEWLEGTLVALVVAGIIFGAWFGGLEDRSVRPHKAQIREAPVEQAAPPPVIALPEASRGKSPANILPSTKRPPEADAQSSAAADTPAGAAPLAAATAPVADGTLALAISPWGEVLVNGRSRGVAPPLARLSLPPGFYTIEIRNTDNLDFSTRIEVKSGQTVTLHHRF